MTDTSLVLLKFLRDHRTEEFGGADLMQETGIGAGTIYVHLSTWQQEGLVSSRWEELPEGVTRPRRRFWRITEAGATAAYFRLGEGRVEESTR
jgi:DNA-binding PadR family transcriptional regulator